VNVRGFFPDGSKIRSFGGPSSSARTFRFVVEMAGAYTLEVTRSATLQSGAESGGNYTITLEQIEPFEDRGTSAAADPYVSPRVETLRQQLARGEADAIPRFWEEITRTGTPLVEPIAGDPEHFLVTFVWRATFPTYNVLVFWNPYATEHPDDFRMAHVAGSDAWVK